MNPATSTNSVKSFIANMAEKNYKEANTSLQQMIEDKLKDRIKEASFAKKTTEIDK